MSLSYKSWAGIAILLVILSLGFSKAPQSKAESADPDCPVIAGTNTELFGWAWSTTTGWMSFNSGNKSGGGGRHCVVVEGTTNNLKGWAWSSTIGWIKFGNLSNFPSGGAPGQNAQISGGQVIGWARACAGTIKSGDDATNPKYAGDCSTMTPRTDGWDGWIELTGANHTLAYSGGNITGFAWGSNVIGLVGFNLTSDTPVVTPGDAMCSFTSVQIPTAADEKNKFEISWGGSDLGGCYGESSAADGRSPRDPANPFKEDPDYVVSGVAGRTTVTPPKGITNYIVKCTSSAGAALSCGAARSLTGSDPTVETAEVRLSVTYKNNTVTNNKDTEVPARVKRGVPFTLRGNADPAFFPSANIIPSDSTGTNVDPDLINADQSVIQTKQTVTYYLEGRKASGETVRTAIKVHAVDSSLEEI